MRSIRRHLTAGLLVAFFVLLGSGSTAVYWWVRSSLYQQFDENLKLKALIIVTDAQTSKGRIRVRFSDRFMREFDDSVATEFFQVFDVDGNTVARSDSLGESKLPWKLHGSIDQPVRWNLTLPNREPGRAIGIRFQVSGPKSEPPQEAIVVVAIGRRSLNQLVTELRNVLLGSGILLGLLSVGVVQLVLRRGLRPLELLAERASGIEASSLSQRFPTDHMPTELRAISERLNDLLSRLELAFERERRFGSDLAHELRTPLAELRSLSEFALKWPQDRDSNTDRSVLEVTLQMESLVSRLLTLTRAEHGRMELKTESVDAVALLTGVLTTLRATAEKRQLVFEKELPSEARLQTDPVLFRVILSNLLENAVHYSPPGGTIRLTLEEVHEDVLLRITNAAPDLDTADLPRMFDRLWRKDAARTESSNTGLGLAICRSFSRLLDLQLKPSLSQSGDLTMTLIWKRGVQQQDSTAIVS